MTNDENKESVESEVNRTRAQALKGRFPLLGERFPRPNIQASIVIMLSIAGVIALIGDIPVRDKTPPDELDRSGLYSAPWIQTWVLSPDGSFAPKSSVLEISVSLPVLPRKHATINGEYSFTGYTYTPGIYRLLVIMPEPTTFTVESGLRFASDSWRLLSGPELKKYQVKLEEEYKELLIMPDRAILLEFTFPNRVSCGEIGADLRFSTSYSRFSRPRGWARQDANILWTTPAPRTKLSREAKSHLLTRCTKIREEGLNGGESGRLALTIGDGQRFEPVFPQPSFPTPYVFLGTPVYTVIPDPQFPKVPTRIAATIENETGRFWANLAIQLLLLGIGALLGGTAFRITGNDKAKRPAPKDIEE